MEEKTLDLICSFERELSVNDIFFLMEQPKINLFELLIKFGKKVFDKDGDFIAEYRSWTSELIYKLNKFRPKIFERKVRELIKKDIIKVRKKSRSVGDVYVDQIDYSLMDEFSIRLFNTFYYGQHKVLKLDDLIIN